MAPNQTGFLDEHLTQDTNNFSNVTKVNPAFAAPSRMAGNACTVAERFTRSGE